LVVKFQTCTYDSIKLVHPNYSNSIHSSESAHLKVDFASRFQGFNQ